MGFLENIRQSFSKAPAPSPNKEYVDKTDSFKVFEFNRPEVPMIIEKRDKEWVLYGETNLYPNKLKELLYTSAIHNGIVVGKTAMTAGKGFLLNGSVDDLSTKEIYDALDPVTKAAYDAFMKNDLDEMSVQQLTHKFAFDWQLYGAFAMEVVWSLDWSRIVKIKYVDVSNVRSGKFNEQGIVERYYYSRDWSKIKQEHFKPTSIKAFDPECRTEYNQLIYMKHGNLEYYGEPQYKGAMSWINIDSQMGLYSLSNIENGFSPSLSIKFYQLPGSPEEKNFIMSNIKNQFGGAKNAGKAMVFFSDGKDLAPDVAPISTDNLSKVFAWYSETSAQQILSGHRVTSPLLFGISVPGALGGNTELATAYQIFDNSVVAYDRIPLENVYNRILSLNKINVTLKIHPFNPLQGLNLTPTG